MSNKSRYEYLKEIHTRYIKSSKEQKKIVLDEFCKVCNYHRKYAIGILNNFTKKKPSRQKKRAGRKQKYHSKEIKEFLKLLRVKTNLICSKRLKAAIPIWLSSYKRTQEVSSATEKLLREISPATIDRVLSEFRNKFKKRGLCTTRPGTLIRELIPIKRQISGMRNVPGLLK